MEDAPCVVVDTNEWIATKWFATPIGKAFFDFVSSSQAVLAIPEVLQVELEKHRVELLSGLIARASTALEDLERASGISNTLPVMSEVEAGISARLASILETAVRLEITQEHARNALKRISEGSPPNGPKNQQAKDSLLWEACLELAETRQVSLVTRDNGFFLDKKPDNGLARNLASEPAVVLGRLAVFPSLESFLTGKLPEQTIQSMRTLESLLEERSREYFYKDPTIPREQVTLKQAKVRLRGFPGQRPEEIALAFTIRFATEQATTSEAGYAEFKGECSLNTTSQKVRDFQIHWWVLSYAGDEGGEGEVEHISKIRKWLAQRGEPEWL